MPVTMKRIAIAGLALTLVYGCSPSEQQQAGDGLRSDVPLREATYYVEHQSDREEMQGICETWKGSQRPIASWPSVVASNCNNVDTARQLIQSKRDRAEFRKGMGL